MKVIGFKNLILLLFLHLIRNLCMCVLNFIICKELNYGTLCFSWKKKLQILLTSLIFLSFFCCRCLLRVGTNSKNA